MTMGQVILECPLHSELFLDQTPLDIMHLVVIHLSHVITAVLEHHPDVSIGESIGEVALPIGDDALLVRDHLSLAPRETMVPFPLIVGVVLLVFETVVDGQARGSQFGGTVLAQLGQNVIHLLGE